MKITLRKFFSAAHFYFQPDWNEEKNKSEFGLCYSKYGHGHNYQWEASFETPSLLIKDELEIALDQASLILDHKHLNFDVPIFAQRIPTTENIALFLAEILADMKLSCPLIHLRVYESANLWTELSFNSVQGSYERQ